MRAPAILDLIEAALHARDSEWIFLRELRIGTGHRQHELQRLDAFALNCYPHLGMKRICYEIKCSRADFLSETRRPLKRRIGLRFSNEFYFVTPPGMIGLDELPIECGLIEVGTAETEDQRSLIRSQNGFFHIQEGDGAYCMTVVPAPWRDTPGPTWQLVASMLRNQHRASAEKAGPPPKQQKLELV